MIQKKINLINKIISIQTILDLLIHRIVIKKVKRKVEIIGKLLLLAQTNLIPNLFLLD